ncbi:MAG: hypothetical protein P8P51_03965 [SAR86 cluster bacterium]|jgi:hypothetical protein|nr:hypothetical protein [SAR86 cluster bacterium]
MTNTAIFGKKGSIAKIDTDSLEALWVSNLSKNYKPTNISNYKNFILVQSSSAWGSHNIDCFDIEGKTLWSKSIDSGISPLNDKDYFYYCGFTDKNIHKVSWKTGEVIFSVKPEGWFKTYKLLLANNKLLAISKKDVLLIDKDNGEINSSEALNQFLNPKKITSTLGDGEMFISSISSESGGADGSVGFVGGDGGGSGGE